MLDLYIFHGRTSPEQDLDDWGPDGPRLKNCIGIHSTYGDLRAIFADADAMNIAKEQTGWAEGFDVNELSMPFVGDLLRAKFPDGTTGFFGDWGLIKSQSLTYDQWLDLVAEYAEKFWLWPRSEALDPAANPQQAYDAKVSPLQYVDALAEKFELSSYKDFNWGNNPPGFIKSRYEVTPE